MGCQYCNMGGCNKNLTNKNSKICCYHVKCCNVYTSNFCHDAANTGQDGGKTYNGMKGGNSLREVGGRDSLANEES